MILLSFTVANHRSIRDEITLDLVRPSLKTLTPKEGSWADHAYPLAGIFGGNATGKSSVLDAMLYMFRAIRDSATSWQGRRAMVREPFRLDSGSRNGVSSYEIEFVHNGTRHQYGFTVDAEGIQNEWLRDVPSLRWRTLLERTRSEEADLLVVHADARPTIDVTPRELVLSRALLMKNSGLHDLARMLVHSFDAVLVKDSHRSARLKSLADSLVEEKITFADLELLLQVADIGVTKVEVEERDLPKEVVRLLRGTVARLNKVVLGEHGTGGSSATSDEAEEVEIEIDDSTLASLARRLLFTHRGVDEDSPTFSIEDESDGTIAWLALGVPALEALRGGALLVVDEIDASLHPHLLDLLLQTFATPEINIHHAQLIFTSHDSYVLTPLSEVVLEPEQVWFTDKTNDGVTELTCLADFPKHADANIARRYLMGRYGGTPRLAPNTFAALVSDEED